MNALKEIKSFINEINAVVVSCRPSSCYYDDEDVKSYTLYPDHTSEEFEDFKDFMNFEYNNGFGGQELYGTIWFKDGTWCTRGEYDGSEWWEHHERPDIITREH